LQTQIEALCGVLVLDKPSGWTSHDAVNKMRRIAGTKKIGHLGTLDPLATGVLPLVVGRATRLAQFYTKDRKAYSATIRFGHSTDSYDRDGSRTSEDKPFELKSDEVEQMLARFRGPLSQMPPAVSAKKINGVPAYKLARQQKPVELKPVDIEVFRLDLEKIEGADIQVHLECTSGTYVRSIAHELGQAMGCGAFVQELRRTLSGEFAIADAKTLEEVEELAQQGRFEESLLRGERLLPGFPSETVDLLTESQIRQGRDFRTSPFRVSQSARLVKAMSQAGELVAIGEQKLPNLYHPILVL
jgi:tRNA pseudouridine55 synthase